MGATGVGQSLQNYGANASSSWLGTLGKMGSGTAGLFGAQGSGVSSGDQPSDTNALEGLESGKENDYKAVQEFMDRRKNMTFMDKLKSNTGDFMTSPKNLLTLGVVGANFMGREKPKSAAQKGRDAKAEMLAARLTPQEMAEQEAYELQLEQSKRRNARKKFLPEERIDIEPLYSRVSSPDEYAVSGRWLNYYDDPAFTKKSRRFS
jgi:hypothetical protein